ncbi:hypothetical protein C8P63_12420 [Melghirimyces profundicolus]|uniref:Uncharacterized protein n=1 Tax=Melghirimyces profundicolus TaxID=1242148 RepID=A0A2T6BD43_9BACL|nr:hypothetical protein [Melghirimyces profundicolus]PTX53964.1 hypothetical protein C8P63_12420 [Melghirimyces profundicolus]
MIQGVKLITGYFDEQAMIRVVFDNGAVIIGPMLPTMAALLRIGIHDPMQKKSPT